MYLVYEFFFGLFAIVKLQLPLRRLYLYLNLNFLGSYHIHSVYVPLQGMYSLDKITLVNTKLQATKF